MRATDRFDGHVDKLDDWSRTELRIHSRQRSIRAVMISINKDFQDTYLGDNAPRFAPGQLVRHRRYGYRGVVVAHDGHCKADPAWYMANKTQPDRDQSWYHVLVHNSEIVTYAAESSLRSDDSDEPVRHALIERFFSAFVDGKFIRNDEPWPRS
ncbi:MAG: heat shock protein HspQ [Fuerstiella sp.]